jgi:hypothetical protein
MVPNMVMFALISMLVDEAFHRSREQRHPSELVRTDFSSDNPDATAPNETLDAIP